MAAASTNTGVVLLDIEGTVCPISFVKDVLFPYAVRVLPKIVETQWDSPDFKRYRDAFPQEHSGSKEAFEAHFNDLVERDVKIAYLKSLQGYLWAEGYKSGEIKAPLFADVPSKMSQWHEKGLQVMIYSSGSVPAQKLLFGHTNAEPSNQRGLISDWFDTVNAGPKTEASSYEKITDNYPGIPPSQWLFLSDNIKEVDAAIAAGLRSYVVQRPGNAELAPEVYDRLHVIKTFDELDDKLSAQKIQRLGKRERESDELQHQEAAEESLAAEEGYAKKKLRVDEDEINSGDAGLKSSDETGSSTKRGEETADNAAEPSEPAASVDAGRKGLEITKPADE